MARTSLIVLRRLLGALPNLLGVVIASPTNSPAGRKRASASRAGGAAQVAHPGRAHGRARCLGAGRGAALLDRLRRELGLATLLVSHDLNVVHLLTDRVAVMYLGKIVETGPSAAVFDHPAHPYAQALVSAIPGLGPRIRLDGEVSSPIDPPPQVCRFASRCAAVQDRRRRESPPLQAGPDGKQSVACHFARWPLGVAA